MLHGPARYTDELSSSIDPVIGTKYVPSWTIWSAAGETVQFSGGHCRSLEFLREGLADFAAIDGVVWEALQRHQPAFLRGFERVGRTLKVPAPPLVTRKGLSGAELLGLRACLRQMARSHREICAVLMIEDFRVIEREEYLFMASPTRSYEVAL